MWAHIINLYIYILIFLDKPIIRALSFDKRFEIFLSIYEALLLMILSLIFKSWMRNPVYKCKELFHIYGLCSRVWAKRARNRILALSESSRFSFCQVPFLCVFFSFFICPDLCNIARVPLCGSWSQRARQMSRLCDAYVTS